MFKVLIFFGLFDKFGLTKKDFYNTTKQNNKTKKGQTKCKI